MLRSILIYIYQASLGPPVHKKKKKNGQTDRPRSSHALHDVSRCIANMIHVDYIFVFDRRVSTFSRAARSEKKKRKKKGTHTHKHTKIMKICEATKKKA